MKDFFKIFFIYIFGWVDDDSGLLKKLGYMVVCKGKGMGK